MRKTKSKNMVCLSKIKWKVEEDQIKMWQKNEASKQFLKKNRPCHFGIQRKQPRSRKNYLSFYSIKRILFILGLVLSLKYLYNIETNCGENMKLRC